MTILCHQETGNWWAKESSSEYLVKITPQNIFPVTPRALPPWANLNYVCQEWFIPRAQEDTSKAPVLLVGMPQVRLRVRHFCDFGIRMELYTSPVTSLVYVTLAVESSPKGGTTGYKWIAGSVEGASNIQNCSFASPQTVPWPQVKEGQRAITRHPTWLPSLWWLLGIGMRLRNPPLQPSKWAPPAQETHWVLSHLSQRCPRSPTAFEGGDPFMLQKLDATPEKTH